jgi:hypothetical protein
MAGAYIEGYCYSEGGSGATVALEANQTLGTASGTYVRPSTPQRFTDQLATWKAQLDAAIPAAAPWVCSYSATTKRVTLASNGAAWTPVLPGNVATWIGFGAYGGTGSSWTGTYIPGARAELIGATVEVAEDWTQTELAQYRHGRANAVVWGNHQVHKVTLHGMLDGYEAIKPGYLQSGRVRIYQDAAITIPYAVDNLGGYIDGYVIACGPAVEQGERWWSWDMLVGVSR